MAGWWGSQAGSGRRFMEWIKRIPVCNPTSLTQEYNLTELGNGASSQVGTLSFLLWIRWLERWCQLLALWSLWLEPDVWGWAELSGQKLDQIHVPKHIQHEALLLNNDPVSALVSYQIEIMLACQFVAPNHFKTLPVEAAILINAIWMTFYLNYSCMMIILFIE